MYKLTVRPDIIGWNILTWVKRSEEELKEDPEALPYKIVKSQFWISSPVHRLALL